MLCEDAHEAGDFYFLEVRDAQVLDAFEEADGTQQLNGLGIRSVFGFNLLADDVALEGGAHAEAAGDDGFRDADEALFGDVEHVLFAQVVLLVFLLGLVDGLLLRVLLVFLVLADELVELLFLVVLVVLLVLFVLGFLLSDFGRLLLIAVVLLLVPGFQLFRGGAFRTLAGAFLGADAELALDELALEEVEEHAVLHLVEGLAALVYDEEQVFQLLRGEDELQVVEGGFEGGVGQGARLVVVLALEGVLEGAFDFGEELDEGVGETLGLVGVVEHAVSANQLVEFVYNLLLRLRVLLHYKNLAANLWLYNVPSQVLSFLLFQAIRLQYPLQLLNGDLGVWRERLKEEILYLVAVEALALQLKPQL